MFKELIAEYYDKKEKCKRYFEWLKHPKSMEAQEIASKIDDIKIPNKEKGKDLR